MSLYLSIILLIVVLNFVWTQYLAYRNRKRMSPGIPSQLEGIYDDDEYAKQQAYQKENSRFGLYGSLFSFSVLLLVLVFGLFGWLDEFLRQFISNEILLTLSFFGVIYLINEILSLPFDYYNTFVIEERFGFNKSTKTIFWLDQLKGLLLAVVLGGTILALITWLYTAIGELAWLYAWGTITVVSLFMTLFYSNIIVPLFNKQTPLGEGELRDAIEAFAQKAGFAINNIYVMDASKRSTKANAYFTGFGAKKRIVLFDTLINDLDKDEIVAVLAHEIGHYKKKHTLQGMFISICYTGIMLFLLSLLLDNKDIAIALGGQSASFHLGLIAFSIFFTPVSFVINVLSSIHSRKNEYQADGYAAGFGLAGSLISGLKKLSVKSLSNLNPDSLYVFFNYSHPTLLQRIKAMKK
ncbi:MAG: M48 family metallopeptidase [Dysgonomonas mossii]|uniref:M48 family metallopeptidase n=1 Tax=Dysgonomonas mossii TaxID=163665 RepID=UPI001D2A70F6|nr:M48 family metallopeptidase [Dysgonomonas mossii]MBS5795164.1 M48 family metallopeptidase [Dysgonomonas mossii]MBS7109692.1 M48 family metallopeptidase [Dysgonomonas mossii]